MMFRVRGLLNKGILAILLLGLASLFVTNQIVSSTHKKEMSAEFKKLKDYHRETTNSLIEQRLEQLVLVAEEIYLLGNWEAQTMQTISPSLDRLWPNLEMTFALSSMVLKQNDNEVAFGELDTALFADLYQKTITSLRPRSQFICRPTCSLVAIIPLFIDNQQAALFISSDIYPTVSSIHAVLTSDVSVMTESSSNAETAFEFEYEGKSYASNASTDNTKIGLIDQKIAPILEQSIDISAALEEGVQVEITGENQFVWVNLIANESDILPIMFVRNVDDLIVQKEQQEARLLTFIASIVLSILVIIAILGFSPIKRLGKLKRTMVLIGDKNYNAAIEALGDVKTGYARDEIDALEREFKDSIYQLVDYERQLSESQKSLIRTATIDSITGLSNRNAFLQNMQSIKSRLQENHTTLLFIDLDAFKNVNDYLGHVAGDTLLKKVGERLTPVCEDDYYLYRIGGDEFLIAIPTVADVSELDAVCKDILRKFDEPFCIDKQTIDVTASIGVATASEHTKGHIGLLRQADIAMYQAKGMGRNQYCVFSNEMMEQINRRYIINSQFPDALASNQLSLVYQPIVDAYSGKLIKLEALSRWMHPEIGFIRPDIFIEVIEETSHIDLLSEWLISQAANKVNELDAMGLNDVVVSINISGAQVSDIDSIGILMIECAKANVKYNRIELEITETSLISDFKRAQDWISKVNKMGFRIAIDDFGTGYSSLSYLTAFPFDCVKLDRSLLLDVEENERTRNIVKSVTSMIHSMNVPVVAEGIETESHLAVIQTLNCDYIQGYYFSRPLPEKDLKQGLQDYIERGKWLPAS